MTPLRQRMLEDMQVRNLSRHTQRAYVEHVARSADDVIPAPKKPRRLPVVLSPDEVARLLDAVTSPKHRSVLTTCYAAGLRISEAVHLRPTDIDSGRMVIRVEQGKGHRIGK